MKKKSLIKNGFASLSLIFLMAFTLPVPTRLVDSASGQNPLLGEQCDMTNNVFEDGEELTYKLYYNWNFVWLSAGEITFRVKDMGNKYYISAIGQTYKSYDWFFKVRDKYEVWLDKETLLPELSVREVQEGGYSMYDKMTFDHKRGKIASLRGKTKDQAQLTEYEVESCLHDILSILYYIRNVEFDSMKQGDNVPIKIFIDKKKWPLRVKYLGKDSHKRIKGVGKFKTLKFSPEVIKGYVFKTDDPMTIWASDDNNRIPLMIESPVRVGSVKAVIKNYKGLKHALAAKVANDVETDNDKD